MIAAVGHEWAMRALTLRRLTSHHEGRPASLPGEAVVALEDGGSLAGNESIASVVTRSGRERLRPIRLAGKRVWQRLAAENVIKPAPATRNGTPRHLRRAAPKPNTPMPPIRTNQGASRSSMVGPCHRRVCQMFGPERCDARLEYSVEAIESLRISSTCSHRMVCNVHATWSSGFGRPESGHPRGVPDSTSTGVGLPPG